MNKLSDFSPLLADLKSYEVKWLPQDLVAGLSVAAVQIPTAMAYAQLAGFSPEIGLYSSILPVIVYAFVGTSKQLVVGPDAATSAMVASLVAPLAGGDPAKYVLLASAFSLVAGVLLLTGGMAKLGFFVNFFARPILVGFLNGIAISIVVGQSGKLFGIALNNRDFIPSLNELFVRIADLNAVTLLVGLATMAILGLVNRIAPRAPSSLIAIAIATCAVMFLGDTTSGVALVGAIPAGLPHLGIPHFDYSAGQGIFVGALGLVIVSFTSGMLTARSFAARTGQTIDANREMFALGLANLSAGFSGGFAITGADSRTAINAASGNKTQLSSVFAAIATALVVTCFSGPLSYMPISALAAVLIFSAFQLLDLASYKALRAIDKFEFRLSLITTCGVLILGVLPGVAFAILLALVMLMVRIYKPEDAVLAMVPGLDGYNDASLSAEAEAVPGVLIWRFDGPLVFFNADYFKSRVTQVVSQTNPAPHSFVYSLEAMSQIDSTGIKAFEDSNRYLRNLGIRPLAARPKAYMLKLKEHSGFGEGDVFPSIRAAVDFVIAKEEHNIAPETNPERS